MLGRNALPFPFAILSLYQKARGQGSLGLAGLMCSVPGFSRIRMASSALLPRPRRPASRCHHSHKPLTAHATTSVGWSSSGRPSSWTPSWTWIGCEDPAPAMPQASRARSRERMDRTGKAGARDTGDCPPWGVFCGGRGHLGHSRGPDAPARYSPARWASPEVEAQPLPPRPVDSHLPGRVLLPSS